MDWYISVIKKYAVFDGRARREEYWMFVLFNFIIALVLGILDIIFGTMDASGYGLLSTIYMLGVLLPGLGVTIRRLHDVGKSGWFIWICLIPIIGGIWLLILLVTDSDLGTNKYGPNPKGFAKDETTTKRVETFVVPDYKMVGTHTLQNERIDLMAPVEIVSYEILKDDRLGSYFNIRFQNLNVGTVAAVRLKISGYNSFDEIVKVNGQDIFTSTLQDFNAAPGAIFTNEMPINLPDKEIRKLDISVSQVRFADGKTFINDNPQIIEHTIKPIVNQRELKVARGLLQSAQCYAEDKGDYWICACGRPNRKELEVCSRCNSQKEYILTNMLEEALVENARMQEIDEQEQKEKLREKAITSKKKAIKFAIIMGFFCAIAIVIGLLLDKVIMPAIAYKNAIALADEGNYKESITIFKELGDYKDSKLMIDELLKKEKENRNLELLEIGTENLKQNKFSEAIANFKLISNDSMYYQDAQNYVKTATDKQQHLKENTINNIVGLWYITHSYLNGVSKNITTEGFNPYCLLYKEYENDLGVMSMYGEEPFKAFNSYNVSLNKSNEISLDNEYILNNKYKIIIKDQDSAIFYFNSWTFELNKVSFEHYIKNNHFSPKADENDYGSTLILSEGNTTEISKQGLVDVKYVGYLLNTEGLPLYWYIDKGGVPYVVAVFE